MSSSPRPTQQQLSRALDAYLSTPAPQPSVTQDSDGLDVFRTASEESDHYSSPAGAITDDIYRYRRQLASSPPPPTFVPSSPRHAAEYFSSSHGSRKNGSPGRPRGAATIGAPDVHFNPWNGESTTPADAPGLLAPGPAARLKRTPSAPSLSSSHPADLDPSTSRALKEPGGFRRAFVKDQARKRREEGGWGAKHHPDPEGPEWEPVPTRNFIEFLALYGNLGLRDVDTESMYTVTDDLDPDWSLSGSGNSADPDPPGRVVRVRRLPGLDEEDEGDYPEDIMEGDGWHTPIDASELDLEQAFENGIARHRRSRTRSDGREDPSENTPLISPDDKTMRLSHSTSQHPGVSTAHAYLLLLKSFIATGILFLPLAFSHGGMLLALVGMIGFGWIGYHCYELLFLSGERTRVRGVWGGELRQVDFGDVAERCGRVAGWVWGGGLSKGGEWTEGDFGYTGRVWGRWMRRVVVGSIAISQCGFGTAYLIFVAQNLSQVLSALVPTITATTPIPIPSLPEMTPPTFFLVLQLCLFIPISFLRQIRSLAFLTLVADAFILLGVAYVCYIDVSVIKARGWGPPMRVDESGNSVLNMSWFVGKEPGLFLGTAVFAFEGVGLVLPIAQSMKHREHFPKVLLWTILTIGAMMILVGTLSYYAFGDSVSAYIFTNLDLVTRTPSPSSPSTPFSVASDPITTDPSPVTLLIQTLYALAILLSFPLAVYPALKIFERWTWGRAGEGRGKRSQKVKWAKNAGRAAVVIGLGLLAYLAGENLDKFVSLVGTLLCTPLSYIFPAAFDLALSTSDKAPASSSTWDRVKARLVTYKNVICVVLGTAATVVLSIDTVARWQT
ncbi:hypothetical protein M427DRAFT_134305 [Gonapodya prolifera JEL478]|uniref:Amino acid transporter transmembrane domain-containing protein n=1 Tax=Gonapodya prolifera (strain JEL478) TaxID=1344416 RepID=A0A139AHI3_GONPJ|nr:hypothetical protein M427DRAFT_134305 [Gonapodya prolifera JEL478]|eukprot:KXS16266.1 hypothetical protein M427DRAFT_134305 [Gonapodya prolifera JEL478]